MSFIERLRLEKRKRNAKERNSGKIRSRKKGEEREIRDDLFDKRGEELVKDKGAKKAKGDL